MSSSRDDLDRRVREAIRAHRERGNNYVSVRQLSNVLEDPTHQAISHAVQRLVDAVRSEAGVGDQTDECRSGTEGCPGPDADVGELPCWQCLTEGADGDRSVATDGGERR